MTNPCRPLGRALVPLILAVGGGCNTRNLATTYHFTQVECITGGVELDPIWFPEVEAGRESAPRSLSLFNSSFLTTQTGANDFEYEGKESRIRVLGFSATECQEGDPDAFFIQPSLSQGAFPVDLEAVPVLVDVSDTAWTLSGHASLGHRTSGRSQARSKVSGCPSWVIVNAPPLAPSVS